MPRKRPNLARLPERDIGIPVAREILRFAFVTPNARFHEKVNPGPSFMLPTYTSVTRGDWVI
jgi:hypothetical protein